MSNNQDPLPPFSEPPKAPRLAHATLPPMSGPGASTSSLPPPPPYAPAPAAAPAPAPPPAPAYGLSAPPPPIMQIIHGNPSLPHGLPYLVVQTVPTVYGFAHIHHVIFPPLPLPPPPPPPVQFNRWYPTPPPSPPTGMVGQP